MLDENKVAFIMCTNSELWYSECKRYIDNLNVPDQMTVEVIPIFNAQSMAQGYNRGMGMTDAKYKVYLHHDAFIIERDFIKKIVRIFKSDKDIGIVGIIGANDISRKKVSWEMWEFGKVIGCTGLKELNIDFGNKEGMYAELDCVDGMLIATQYDVRWREDIFKKWHFYDRSICMEFRRKGYKCVVPNTDEAWCIHDCGASDLSGWCDSLKIFLMEYQDYYNIEWYQASIDFEYTNDKLWKQLGEAVTDLDILFDNKQYKVVDEYLNTSLNKYIFLSKQLINYIKIFEVLQEKDSKVFTESNRTIKECTRIYTVAKFILRRLLYNMYVSEEEEQLINNLTAYELECIVSANLNYSIKRLKNKN